MVIEASGWWFYFKVVVVWVELW